MKGFLFGARVGRGASWKDDSEFNLGIKIIFRFRAVLQESQERGKGYKGIGLPGCLLFGPLHKRYYPVRRVHFHPLGKAAGHQGSREGEGGHPILQLGRHLLTLTEPRQRFPE